VDSNINSLLQQRGSEIRTIVPQRAVGRDMDLMLVAKVDEIILQQERMHFDLVHDLRVRV
jgi:hypothetical protein